MPEAAKPSTTPSLPGAMARRTDGGPASKQAIRYAAGEPGAEDFVNLQRQAPLAKTPGVKSMPSAQIAQAGAQAQPQQEQQQQPMPNPISAIPLGAPTQYPGQPVTHGAAAGPGAGPEALILPEQTPGQYQSALQMFQTMASQPNASAAVKYLAQRSGQVF